MPVVYINGKFLAQRRTGVQRFALGVLLGLDNLLYSCGSKLDIILLVPAAAKVPVLKHIRFRVVGCRFLSLSLWEQIALPLYSCGGTLLCLSGSAPLFVRNCLPTIHDAAIFLFPQAYSNKFVAWYRTLFLVRAFLSPLVLTVSRTSVDDLTRFLPTTSFRVVPNSAEHILQVASDSSVLLKFSLERGKFLLAVGSINPTKNFSFLISTYCGSDLVERMPLVVVGGWNNAVFDHSGLPLNHKNVVFTGSLPDSQLRALYEAASAFVFPSLYEGFGIPPLEAMACGCPVIASSCPSILETCGNAAKYFDPVNGDDMLNAIYSVIGDSEIQTCLITNGNNRVADFSWDKSALLLRDALCEFGYLD
jgi:glycosyltransferase involved in cell wall biosynthesis